MLNHQIYQAVVTAAACCGSQCNCEQALVGALVSKKDVMDACRKLSVAGTKNAVAPLAALLADPELNHMARYALEPIPDPSVDDALRDALGKLQGLPLAGVAASIGVRRDPKAIEPLAKLLQNSDAHVAQIAARSLGTIGTIECAKAIQDAMANAPAANKLAFCDGLFRCAESLRAQGFKDLALGIYDFLAKQDIKQVKSGAECASACLRK